MLFYTCIFLLTNCGLPDEPYLPPISTTAIQVDMTTSATIQLPASITDDQTSPFTSFKLFYRIYISDINIDAKITQDRTDLMRDINPTLQSHVGSINTDPNNAAINTSTVRSYFTNYKFYELGIEGRNIDTTFLSSSGSLLLDFPLTGIPYAKKGNNSYNLYRSTGEGTVTTMPTFKPATEDRYLRNTPELNDNTYATANDNGDVQINTSAVGTPRYTYILIYIISSGFNSATLSVICSAPTYVGIFRLPEVNIGES